MLAELFIVCADCSGFMATFKIENTNCCNDLHIKCWRHYLKDIKVERFKPFRGCEDNVAELMDRWLLIPEGELWLRLDWCFSELNEKL